MSFVDAWQDRIWPVIEQDFAALSQERPCKQDEGAVGQHYGGKKISDFLKQSGEARNVTCNLTWMKVLQMAPTNQNLSYAMVEKAAQTLWHQDGQPRLPQLWPRELNIPIACLTTDEPVKGEMTRYGCCLAVCSFWLTYYQAKTGGNTALLQKMKALALNVPFDFKLFANQDEVLNAAAEGLEANEMLRELFGLSGIVLINLVMEVRDMLGRRTSGKKDATAIAEHLATLRWYDMKRCPKKDTCESYLHIGGMLRRAPRAQVAIEIAAVKYGRDTIFDEPSKLLLFVQKALNVADFEFMMEGLLVNMIRTNNADRQSVAELKSKAGDPAFWLFIRRYFLHLERQYPMPALPATGSNPMPPATGGNPPPPAASSGQQPPPPALPATGSNPRPSTNPHLAARPSATPKASDPMPPGRGGTGGRGAKGGGGRRAKGGGGRGAKGGDGRRAKGGGGRGAKGGGGRETNRDRLLAFSLIAHLRQRNRRPVRCLADALGCSADDVRGAASLCPGVLELRGEILELLK